MSSIILNENRIGNFTSSGIFALMTNGKVKGEFSAVAKTYISEKNLERKLGRSIDVDKSTKAMLWGLFMEMRVHEMLPPSYQITSRETMDHPHIPFWKGSIDNICESESVVGDTKCYEPKAFAEYVDTLTECKATGNLDLFKKKYPKEYYQLISNSCITGMKYIEPIVYMPYLSEIDKVVDGLPSIRKMAEDYDCPDPWKYRFIAEAPVHELSYLPDGGYYKNLNIFRFEAPEADKVALTETVLRAGKELIKPITLLAGDNINGQNIIIAEGNAA